MRRFVAIVAIVVLGLGLLVLLIFRPWEADNETPRFVDRLPLDDIIGKTDLLALSRDLAPITYSNQLPFREFITPEFILSQGKISGLNLQEPVYFFGNQVEGEINDWGVLISVSDSSKVFAGIKRFEKASPMTDSLLYNQRIFTYPEFDITVGYGEDWLLLTNRKSFKKYFNHVLHARLKAIYPRWRKFIEEKQFADKSLQASVTSKELRKYGVKSALLGTSSDSLSITLHTRLTCADTIPFTLKESGERYERRDYTKRMINLHLNIDRLKNNPDHPLYGVLEGAARKISFPLSDFLETWEGDILFRQGGLQTVLEQYIESELDENFNITEVVKYNEKRISGFAMQLSMNDNRNAFMNKLYTKGILTKEGNKARMLYFPPMNVQNGKNSVNFYTSSVRPTVVEDATQSVLWDFNYTPVIFTIDSLDAKTAYGIINIGLKKILKDKLTNE